MLTSLVRRLVVPVPRCVRARERDYPHYGLYLAVLIVVLPDPVKASHNDKPPGQ